MINIDTWYLILSQILDCINWVKYNHSLTNNHPASSVHIVTSQWQLSMCEWVWLKSDTQWYAIKQEFLVKMEGWFIGYFCDKQHHNLQVQVLIQDWSWPSVVYDWYCSPIQWVVQSQNILKNWDDNCEQVSLKESAYVTPGSEILPPVETPLGPLGLGICYDIRFAEHSQELIHRVNFLQHSS